MWSKGLNAPKKAAAPKRIRVRTTDDLSSLAFEPLRLFALFDDDEEGFHVFPDNFSTAYPSFMHNLRRLPVFQEDTPRVVPPMLMDSMRGLPKNRRRAARAMNNALAMSMTPQAREKLALLRAHILDQIGDYRKLSNELMKEALPLLFKQDLWNVPTCAADMDRLDGVKRNLAKDENFSEEEADEDPDCYLVGEGTSSDESGVDLWSSDSSHGSGDDREQFGGWTIEDEINQ
jgi:hypothetical protein